MRSELWRRFAELSEWVPADHGADAFDGLQPKTPAVSAFQLTDVFQTQASLFSEIGLREVLLQTTLPHTRTKVCRERGRNILPAPLAPDSWAETYQSAWSCRFQSQVPNSDRL